MPNAPLPWMKFYVRDWQSSARVRVMSMEARGIYLSMLLLQWEEGCIPSDMDDLATILGIARETLDKHWRHLEAAFPVDSDGCLRNPKLAEEREEAYAYKERQAAKGRASATRKSTTVQPRLSPGSTTVQPRFNHTDTDADTHTDADIERDAPKRKRKAIAPPTVDEVRAFMVERGWTDVDANARKFHDYYSVGDWKRKDGKPVLNWKQTVVTWEGRNQPKEKKETQSMDEFLREMAEDL